MGAGRRLVGMFSVRDGDTADMAMQHAAAASRRMELADTGEAHAYAGLLAGLSLCPLGLTSQTYLSDLGLYLVVSG